MNLVRIVEDTSDVLRLEPGNDQRAAIATTIVFGCVIAACAMFSGQGYEFRVALGVVAAGFFLAAYLVYNQQRSVEVNGAEACFYVFGRQPTDMYCIPFHHVACLRVVSRVHKRRPGRMDRDSERFYLDIVRRDGGYETLERSSEAKDVAALAMLLSERTGLELLDDAKLGVARHAEVSYPAAVMDVPDNPPPRSVVRKRQDRRGAVCSWSLSPGKVALVLMGGVGFGLLLIGMFGVAEVVRPSGNVWAGTVTAVVAGFFAYQVSWRIMRGALCTGYASMNFDGLHAGTFCMNDEHEKTSVPLVDVVAFRIVAPRYAHARWEMVTKDGEVVVLARILPGLAPLTLGDLHWLNAHFTSVLASGRYAQ